MNKGLRKKITALGIAISILTSCGYENNYNNNSSISKESLENTKNTEDNVDNVDKEIQDDSDNKDYKLQETIELIDKYEVLSNLDYVFSTEDLEKIEQQINYIPHCDYQF